MINCNLCIIYRRSSIKNNNFKKDLLSLLCSTTSSSKRTSSEFPPVYDPKTVEKDRYDWWEKNGCFKSKNPQSINFSMILPPPNITGTLHLGHTLVCTIQDVLARWKKMQGVPVSWIPGIDHAGIATQVVVERKLWKEKMCTRHDVGRENFIKLISKWKSEKEKIICDQLRKLGASVNWDDIFFTLDPERTTSVVEAFIKLYESGLIYRTNSIINWSTIIKSAISDIEIDLKEVNAPTLLDVPGYDNPVEFGIMTEVACKLYGSDEEISIATTRVETMPGDVAIAVNPNDDRYAHLHGKMVFHPIRNVCIPIICDEFVDPEFGTGAVKITPAHNKNDFLVGEKHNLKIIHAIDEDGRITNCCPQFAGLKRFEARRKILEKLESQGLVRSKKPHSMQIPFCSRSGDVLEFLIKPQWKKLQSYQRRGDSTTAHFAHQVSKMYIRFLNCSKMAEFAANSLKEEKIQIIPPSFNNIWLHWLENSRDWCLSRQLWWGHQIPMYECRRRDGNETTFWTAAHSLNEAKCKASKRLGVDEDNVECKQDPDVLDTWFSSALLPFSSHGWPKKTKEFASLYPLSLMATGNDILFFWVARMVMLGYELTGKLPFQKILLNGIICDAEGRKMSKSLGNVISPEDVIKGATLKELNDRIQESHNAGYLSSVEVERATKGQKKLFPKGIPECGVDALRFTLCSHKTSSQYINFDVNECHINRLFCNKIWQAAKYVCLCHDGYPQHLSYMFTDENFTLGSLGQMELWILSRMYEAISNVEKGLENFDFYSCTAALKNFIYYEFCDIYLETTKEILKKGTLKTNEDNFDSVVPTSPSPEGVLSVLRSCLGTSMKALAPFMPFLAEDLYQQFLNLSPNKERSKSIFLTSFPRRENLEKWQNKELEEKVKLVMEIVVAVRRLMANNRVQKKDSFSCHVQLNSSDELANMTSFLRQFKCLTRCDNLTLGMSTMPSDRKDSTDLGFCTVHLSLPAEKKPIQSSEINKSIERKQKLLKQLQKLISTTEAPSYKNKVPEQIQKSHTEKIIKLQEKIKRLEAS